MSSIAVFFFHHFDRVFPVLLVCLEILVSQVSEDFPARTVTQETQVLPVTMDKRVCPVRGDFPDLKDLLVIP
jgi:hypothetical protein